MVGYCVSDISHIEGEITSLAEEQDLVLELGLGYHYHDHKVPMNAFKLCHKQEIFNYLHFKTKYIISYLFREESLTFCS